MELDIQKGFWPVFPEEAGGQPAGISKSRVSGDLPCCLLIYGMCMEGVADAGSRFALSRKASPHSNLAVSIGLQVNIFYKMQAITSSYGMLCLIFVYSLSDRTIHFAGNSPTLHKVLMQLLNWKTHSLCLMSYIPWGLGAAKCPKLILNLLGIKDTQQLQRSCQDGIRLIYFGGVTAWQTSVMAFWLSLPVLYSLMTAVKKPAPKQMTSCDITYLKTFMHVTLKHCMFF